VAAGRRVRFFAADELSEALYRGLADNSVGRLIGGLLRHELIVIDDLGFTALDRVAAEHLFRLVAAAYERRSLIVTTNVAFERWTQFLPDETVATAILDRLLHHCHVVALAGESYRLREARRVVTPA
jgi:DNA replication protein DnaC